MPENQSVLCVVYDRCMTVVNELFASLNWALWVGWLRMNELKKLFHLLNLKFEDVLVALLQVQRVKIHQSNCIFNYWEEGPCIRACVLPANLDWWVYSANMEKRKNPDSYRGCMLQMILFFFFKEILPVTGWIQIPSTSLTPRNSVLITNGLQSCNVFIVLRIWQVTFVIPGQRNIASLSGLCTMQYRRSSKGWGQHGPCSSLSVPGTYWWWVSYKCHGSQFTSGGWSMVST